jgi:anti-sigma factor ChrR (cupin superfamily)
MDAHPEDALVDAALGTLSPGEAQRVLDHVRACAHCQQLQAALRPMERHVRERLAVPPSPGILTALLAEVRGGARFAHFVPAVSDFFDLPPSRVTALLERVDDPAAWMEGPGPGIQLMPVEAGPRVASAACALVRLDPGAEFPHHEHCGPEEVLVLQGSYRDAAGFEVWRGEVSKMETGSSHSFRAIGRMPCLCAAVTFFHGPEDA